MLLLFNRIRLEVLANIVAAITIFVLPIITGCFSDKCQQDDLKVISENLRDYARKGFLVNIIDCEIFGWEESTYAIVSWLETPAKSNVHEYVQRRLALFEKYRGRWDLLPRITFPYSITGYRYYDGKVYVYAYKNTGSLTTDPIVDIAFCYLYGKKYDNPGKEIVLKDVVDLRYWCTGPGRK